MGTEKIFISYKRTDLDRVREIVNEIKDRTEVNCWIDLKGIDSTEYFEEVIIEAIDRCEHFIFMLSKDSIKTYKKVETWPQMEINFAKRLGKDITIVSIDGTTVDENKWWLFKYGGLNCIDYSNSDQKEILFNDIRRRFGTQKPDFPPEETPKKQEEKPAAQQLFEKGKAEYDRKNYSEAVKWWKKSAKQGYADAQYWLGNYYYYHRGFKKNYSEARFLYQKAAEQGHEDAKNMLEKMDTKGL